MPSVTELFTAHPRTVDENYLQHARVASGYALRLALAAAAALVHAVLPFLFVRTTRDAIEKLHASLSARH